METAPEPTLNDPREITCPGGECSPSLSPEGTVDNANTNSDVTAPPKSTYKRTMPKNRRKFARNIRSGKDQKQGHDRKTTQRPRVAVTPSPIIAARRSSTRKPKVSSLMSQLRSTLAEKMKAEEDASMEKAKTLVQQNLAKKHKDKVKEVSAMLCHSQKKCRDLSEAVEASKTTVKEQMLLSQNESMTAHIEALQKEKDNLIDANKDELAKVVHEKEKEVERRLSVADSTHAKTLHFKELNMKRELNSLKAAHKEETVDLKRKANTLSKEKVQVAAFHRDRVQTMKDTHDTEIKEYKSKISSHKLKNRSLKEKNRRQKRKNKTLKKNLAGVENELQLRQCWEKRQLQAEHAERLSKEKDVGKSKLKELQDLTLEMRSMMQCHAADMEIKDGVLQNLRRKMRRLSKSETSATDRAAKNKVQMAEWKTKHDRLMDQLAEEQKANGELADEVVQWKETVSSLKDQLIECHDTIHDMTPITIKKVWVKNIGKRGGRMEWVPEVDKIVIEMLANRTPPSCIQANLLAMARTLTPKQDIVKELPSIKHIRNLRTVLLTTTKTLAAYQVANSKKIKQVHTDETSKWKKKIMNVVVGMLDKNDQFKTLCLAGDIIPPDGTAVEQSKALIQSFRDAAKLLDSWRDKTAEMYTNDPELPLLLDKIPSSEGLCPSRLLRCTLETDNCNAANATQCETAKLIYKIAREKGITDSRQLVVHFGNCHHHIRNVWCKALSKRLQERLELLLKRDLDLIPWHLRVSCDLMNMHRCIDKECNGTANYDKGHGDECQDFISRNHPGLLKLPILRTICGSRHDAEFEACLGNYWARPQLIEWLMYALSKPKNEGTLQRALFIILTSNEMGAQLRVGAIYFIAVVVPMRWLAGKTHLLAHRKWGERSMSKPINYMYTAMKKLQEDGSLILVENFMMNIFKPLFRILPEFQDYMNWYFEEKTSTIYDSTNQARIKGIKTVRKELFHPLLPENIETTEFCELLGEELGDCIVEECESKKTGKVTHKYIDVLDGELSTKKTSKRDLEDSFGCRANNDPSEGGFATLDDALSTMGRVNISRGAGVGMTRYNKDFDRGAKLLVTGRTRKTDDDTNEFEEGIYHQIGEKLQNSLIATSKQNFNRTHANCVQALQVQQDKKTQKRKDLEKGQIDIAKSEFAEATWLHQQFSSPRFCRTAAQVFREFDRCGSAAQELKFIKEQHLIVVLGCGIGEAHHPWSMNGKAFTSVQLLKNFVNNVLPLLKTKKIPKEPPIRFPTVPTMPQFGKRSCAVEKYYSNEEVKKNEAMFEAYKKRDENEAAGIGDQCEYLQSFNWPSEKRLKKGFRLEMLFEYPDQGLIWVPGVVQVINKVETTVIKATIKWDSKYIGEGEDNKSVEKLKKNKWNPESPGDRAWREDLRHLMKKIN